MAEAIVSTRAGKVRGMAADGVLTFKGIRYAAPPIDALRFAPPAPVTPWKGLFDALEYGPSAPQPVARPAGWTHESIEDEDCLRLNVWTPATRGARRPVMVWFHGGGFVIGSGSWPVYDGSNLARRGDAVIVSVNHRLGALGYLHLARFGGGELASSGNAGMLDLVAALEWVRDNIAAFGGNPENVTIFGESGGGAKVCTLLAMPSARGLFHRAVVQSGPMRYALSAEQATAHATRFLRELGIADDANAVRALRALPAQQLIAAQGDALLATAGQIVFSPVIDGMALPVHPAHALQHGQAPDVPLLIGTNFDEATLFLGRDPVLLDPSRLRYDDLPGRLRHLGEHASRLLAAYKKNRPDAPPLDILLAIVSDARMRIPSIKLAEKKLAGPGQTKVFMYLFCWAAGPHRSGHGFELPFVFDNIHEPVLHPTPSRMELATRMSEAWLSFARTGDPNHGEFENWPAYDTERRATMIFNRGRCEVIDDPWGPERAAWTAVHGQPR
jgi:para-nitrobenzyl esterase